MPRRAELRATWDGTITAGERLRGDPRYEEPAIASPTGKFAGRPIIARDTRITGGVYIGGGSREAIVVDDDRYSGEYNRVYTRLRGKIYEIAEEEPQSPVLNKVLVPTFDIVRASMPLNIASAGPIEGRGDKKINLGWFIQRSKGICRHHALLAGYLLERLQAEEELLPEDRVSIDRNYVAGAGGHAWVRYTSSDGTPYVLDPAQGIVDRLDVSQEVDWDYRRPGEIV